MASQYVTLKDLPHLMSKECLYPFPICRPSIVVEKWLQRTGIFRVLAHVASTCVQRTEYFFPIVTSCNLLVLSITTCTKSRMEKKKKKITDKLHLICLWSVITFESIWKLVRNRQKPQHRSRVTGEPSQPRLTYEL